MAGKNMNRRKEDILNNLFSGKGNWQPSPLFVPPVQVLQKKYGRPRWEDVQQSRETLERDRSLFNKISPFNVQRSTIPELEEIERSGQMHRGAFKPDSWEGPKGEVYNTPTDQMGPPAYQPDRRQPSYNGESSGLQELSPEAINQLNQLRQQEELNRAMPQQRQQQPIQPTIWDYLNSLKRNVQ